MMSEKKFGVIFHSKRAAMFNILHLVFKYTYLWSPALIFIWFVFPSLWIFPSISFFAFVAWLASVKMKSLRNINYYAARIFEQEHDAELKEMFR